MKFAVISDKYSNECYLTTLEGFLDDCQEAFGNRPELHHQYWSGSDGNLYDCYVDEDNDVILSSDPDDLAQC